MPDQEAQAYASMSEFRRFVRNLATTDATDPDTTLELIALEAARVAIDRACNRRFDVTLTNAEARYFTAERVDGRYVVEIDDLMSLSALVVELDTNRDYSYSTATTDFRARPTNGPSRDIPYTSLLFDLGTFAPTHEDGVKVTAKFGWTATPSTIKQANLLQAARFLKRRDAAFGISGSPEMQGELRLLAKLDPDVALLVSNFRRNWAVAR